jgi:hypothetical protein
MPGHVERLQPLKYRDAGPVLDTVELALQFA